MIVPYFLERIWHYTPKISFKFLEIESPAGRQFASTQTLVRQARYTPIPTPNYSPYKQVNLNPIGNHRYQALEWPPRPAPNPTRLVGEEDRRYHKRVCERYYKLQTLDGSDYFQCQHGYKVK